MQTEHMTYDSTYLFSCCIFALLTVAIRQPWQGSVHARCRARAEVHISTEIPVWLHDPPLPVAFDYGYRHVVNEDHLLAWLDVSINNACQRELTCSDIGTRCPTSHARPSQPQPGESGVWMLSGCSESISVGKATNEEQELGLDAAMINKAWSVRQILLPTLQIWETGGIPVTWYFIC
ncbi:hypothetical protein GGS24DRAFT_390314 [Hypoxylon argillaceum]|nr:hypothetical protein GGS24DRAFT_390314 [Hypoxylon argillaceum]